MSTTKQENDLTKLRYNEVQWKAAHNSVERNETIFEQLDPFDGNCGAIELDFVVDPTSVEILNTQAEAEKLDNVEKVKYERWRFSVQHEEKYDKKNSPMHEVLRSLKKWSEEHPNHAVVTICLDLKRGGCFGKHVDFVKQLDGAIKWGLGRERVYTPGDLQKDSLSLLAAVRDHQWPTLLELQNKFLLVISGSDNDLQVQERRNIYSSCDPLSRLCFVDIDQRGCELKNKNCDILHAHYQQGDRVFVNIQLGNNDWQKLGRDAYSNGFVSRVWKANKKDDWEAAQEARIHLIATDKIRNSKWAFINSPGNNFAVINTEIPK